MNVYLEPDFDLSVFQAEPGGELLPIRLCDVFLELKLSLEAFSLEIAEHRSAPRTLSLHVRGASVGGRV